MSGFLRGALAGAAGTTALNAVTYLDMAVRGRGTSDTPERLVERAAGAAGVSIPGDGDERDNRLAGLGPLSGTAVGVVVGAVYGALDRALARRGRAVPAPVEIAAIGATAMALSDVPLTVLGISDARTWAAKDWLADGVPHLAYAVVTYAGIRAARASA